MLSFFRLDGDHKRPQGLRSDRLYVLLSRVYHPRPLNHRTKLTARQSEEQMVEYLTIAEENLEQDDASIKHAVKRQRSTRQEQQRTKFKCQGVASIHLSVLQ
jgi:hypothetical protein